MRPSKGFKTDDCMLKGSRWKEEADCVLKDVFN